MFSVALDYSDSAQAVAIGLYGLLREGGGNTEKRKKGRDPTE